jgi:hypothetical protein
VNIAKPPKVQSREIEIITIEQAQKILQRLRGHALYPITALALATEMPCARSSWDIRWQFRWQIRRDCDRSVTVFPCAVP